MERRRSNHRPVGVPSVLSPTQLVTVPCCYSYTHAHILLAIRPSPPRYKLRVTVGGAVAQVTSRLDHGEYSQQWELWEKFMCRNSFTEPHHTSGSVTAVHAQNQTW